MTPCDAVRLIEAANKLNKIEDHISLLLAGRYYESVRQWGRGYVPDVPPLVQFVLNQLPAGYQIRPFS